MSGEPDPKFERVALAPVVAKWVCPVCGMSDHVNLSEDDAGRWSVLLEDRYRQCELCNANLDLGLGGWRWSDHSDGDAA